MLFSSVIFLWIFLPVVLVGNFILSRMKFQSGERRIRAKNGFLLTASLVFYAWGGIYYLFIMLFSIGINFIGGRAIGRPGREAGAKKRILLLTISLNLGMLFYFKYFNMLLTAVEALLQSEKGAGSVLHAMLGMERTGATGIADVVLPIGISFFTFQAMSYVLDVYRGKTPVQESLPAFALYVALFPQLIAGPIVQYNDVAEQLGNRRETLGLFSSGQKRFCYGLAKKVLIANTLAEVADQVWALETGKLGASVAWLGMVSYTLQIYYDFSGYSDMAIGIGRMFGFRFKENFRYPYTSLSVREFWRRWHISLSAWFREYVYIPLGGSRDGTLRTCRNLFIVFLLTGIWHGANFTFWSWGLYYAVFMIAERLFLGRWLDKNRIRPLNWMYTMFVVMVGWVYFRSDNIWVANAFVGQLFRFGAGEYSVLSFLSMKVILAFGAAILCGGFLQRGAGKLRERMQGYLVPAAADYCLQLVLFVLSIMLIVSGTYNPFIYFQF